MTIRCGQLDVHHFFLSGSIWLDLPNIQRPYFTQITPNLGCSVVTPFLATANATGTCTNTGSVTVNVSGGQAPFQFNIGNGNQASNVFNNLTSGNYVVTITANNGCSTTTNITVPSGTVTPTFNNILPTCTGTVLSPLPTTSINGITGTWSPALNNTATTTYTFTPTSGQCATTITLAITVNPAQTANFPTPPSFCSGTTAPILSNTAPNGVAGTWLPTIVSNSISCNYVFTPTNSCHTGQTLAISVNPVVQITATINEIKAFQNEYDIIVNALPIGKYLYSLDDGTFQESNVFSNISSCEHKILVKDISMCSNTASITFFVLDYPHFFTPNDDDINDFWNVFCNEGYKAMTINIFDRYGKLLSQFNSKSYGWNGKYNGYILPSDDYWFTVDYIENGISKTYKNHFAMKR